MAVLHRKEEKIQAVLGRLPKKYNQEQFVEMFIKLYSKDWGKIKSAYIKQSQDKLPGAIINMPKPEIYLKQILTNYLQNVDEVKSEVKVEPAPVAVAEVKKPKATENKAEEAKPKKATAKKAEKTEEAKTEAKKAKAVAKKEVDKAGTEAEKPVKVKTVAKIKDEKAKAMVEKPAKVKVAVKKTVEEAEKPEKIKVVAKKKAETTEEKPKTVKKTPVKK